MMTLLKHGNIYAIIRNYILVCTKYEVNAWHRVIDNMGRFSIISLYPVDDMRESIS